MANSPDPLMFMVFPFLLKAPVQISLVFVYLKGARMQCYSPSKLYRAPHGKHCTGSPTDPPTGALTQVTN